MGLKRDESHKERHQYLCWGSPKQERSAALGNPKTIMGLTIPSQNTLATSASKERSEKVGNPKTRRGWLSVTEKPINKPINKNIRHQ